MSYLARTLTPLRATSRLIPSRSVAAFHTSFARRGLNEDNIHREDRDKHIDHHQKDSLDKAKTGQGEWKPELGSNSENAIAGDKHNMTMEEMQKLGEKRSEEDKNPGGSDSSKGAHDL
ncbi:hypothetical protein PV11_02410 [Exophiala sideris]|uniref:Uncharacterized protein n=1 Tax=Exophiala sideris TaxID=1016849 RepID=A0A0D1WDG8_9EURO|nr:hypothetical protein PV11_02410 [Exophiala sideris]